MIGRRGIASVPARRAARLVWSHWRIVAAFLAASLIGGVLGVIPPFLFGTLIDRAVVLEDTTALHSLGALAALTAIGVALATLGARWLSTRLGEAVVFDLRVAMFEHIQRLPISFFTHSQTGALVARVSTDVAAIRRVLSDTLSGTVQSAVAAAVVSVTMLVLNWKLALLTLAIIPTVIVPTQRAMRRMRALTHQQLDVIGNMNETLVERFNVSGALLVKLFGRRPRERQSFEEGVARVRDVGVRLNVLMGGFYSLLNFMSMIAMVAIYWIGGAMIVSGAISIGTVVMFATYVVMLYSPVIQLTGTPVELAAAFAAFERVFEILDFPIEIDDPEEPRRIAAPQGRVELDDVWFTYGSPQAASLDSLRAPGQTKTDTEPVLRGVTFTADAGRMIALVGPSGAGKTTIGMLLARLYDPDRGTIRIDGIDIRDLALDDLQDMVAVVTQEAHLFHDTLANNLRYARPDATLDEIVDACRQARIHDTIVGLPQGYETVVGERGHRFSGGEKQRIALARALLKRAAIVVLDEATAHLDAETEASLQEVLEATLRGTTRIVIAHRLSTIRSANEILVLAGGRVVQRGAHADLVGVGGPYLDLYRQQFADAPQGVQKTPAPSV